MWLRFSSVLFILLSLAGMTHRSNLQCFLMWNFRFLSLFVSSRVLALKTFVYLKEWQRERGREIDFASACLLPKCNSQVWARLNPGGRNSDLDLCVDGRGPSKQANFCLCKCVSRKLDRKQSFGDSSRCSTVWCRCNIFGGLTLCAIPLTLGSCLSTWFWRTVLYHNNSSLSEYFCQFAFYALTLRIFIFAYRNDYISAVVNAFLFCCSLLFSLIKGSCILECEFFHYFEWFHFKPLSY